MPVANSYGAAGISPLSVCAGGLPNNTTVAYPYPFSAINNTMLTRPAPLYAMNYSPYPLNYYSQTYGFNGSLNSSYEQGRFPYCPSNLGFDYASQLAKAPWQGVRQDMYHGADHRLQPFIEPTVYGQFNTSGMQMVTENQYPASMSPANDVFAELQFSPEELALLESNEFNFQFHGQDSSNDEASVSGWKRATENDQNFNSNSKRRKSNTSICTSATMWTPKSKPTNTECELDQQPQLPKSSLF